MTPQRLLSVPLVVLVAHLSFGCRTQPERAVADLTRVISEPMEWGALDSLESDADPTQESREPEETRQVHIRVKLLEGQIERLREIGIPLAEPYTILGEDQIRRLRDLLQPLKFLEGQIERLREIGIPLAEPYTILEEDQIRRLRDLLQPPKEAPMPEGVMTLQAPELTTFSGQTARIAVVRQTQFIKDYEWQTDRAGDTESPRPPLAGNGQEAGANPSARAVRVVGLPGSAEPDKATTALPGPTRLFSPVVSTLNEGFDFLVKARIDGDGIVFERVGPRTLRALAVRECQARVTVGEKRHRISWEEPILLLGKSSVPFPCSIRIEDSGVVAVPLHYLVKQAASNARAFVDSGTVRERLPSRKRRSSDPTRQVVVLLTARRLPPEETGQPRE